MKTTLNIDAQIMAKLKQAAAAQGKTMGELVESALRTLLEAEPAERPPLPPLPVLRSGGLRVDVADRDGLYEAMEGR